MPKPKPTPPPPAPAPAADDKARRERVFVARKVKTQPTLTHERIADDLAAFRKAGGKIEVLGNTRTLTRLGAEGDIAPPAAAAKAMPRKPAR